MILKKTPNFGPRDQLSWLKRKILAKLYAKLVLRIGLLQIIANFIVNFLEDEERDDK